MSVVLVVERDASCAESISEALRSDGLTVETAGSHAEALRRAQARAPQLLLASASLPRAKELFAAFSRRRGGPGAVALVPVAHAARASAADFEADELLAKPFSDDALRQMVQRYLQPLPRRPPTAEDADSEQLTSADIFGEVLAEVEAEARRSKAAAARVRQPEAPMDDIERKLEETLSGVFPPVGKSKPSAARQGRCRELPNDTEIDDLLDRTLSSLDISTRRSKKPAAGGREQSTPAAAPAARGSLEPPELEPLEFEPPELELDSEPPGRDPQSEPAPVEPPAPAPPGSVQEPPPARPGSPEAAGAAGLGQIRPADEFRTQALPAPDLIKEVEKEAQGQAFGDYTLLDRIAVGGMAEVWRARRRGVEGFQKTVAIKKILSHLTGSSDFVTMFIDEAKLAAQLTHNNIIQIYDLGKVGDDFFIAMELVDGKDLRSILTAAQEAGRPVPIHLGLFIVKALARALDYAHRKRDFENRALGLVHRDVSPQNVLISWEGEIKLCDFGIVKAVAKASTTQMGALKGKLQYMSPEQAWGKHVDARSDIFSLGSVLFEVLTGRQLFEADTEIGVLDAVRECRSRSARELVPEIPEKVDRTLKTALAQTPEGRFQTAGELEHELQAALDEMRPAPSQKDLATYLRFLFWPSGVVPASPPTASPPAASPPAEEPPVAPPPAEEPPVAPPPAEEPPAEEDSPPAPEAPEAAVEATVRAEPAESDAPTDAPTGEDETETDRGRGLKWLIAAVVVGAVIAAWLLWLRPPRDEPPPAVAEPGPAVEETAPPAPPTSPAATPGDEEAARTAAPSDDAEPGGEGVASEAGEVEPAATGFAATAGIDIEQLVTEELNSRAERLRQDFEAERQRIEEELARTRAADPLPVDEPQDKADGGGGSGDGP